MSSWVDSGLDAARCTSAPPAVSSLTSTAVSGVTCRHAATVSPANGCSRRERLPDQAQHGHGPLSPADPGLADGDLTRIGGL